MRGLRLFHWLCASEIPAACDLRRCGWELASGRTSEPSGGKALRLAHRAGLDDDAWTALIGRVARQQPARVLLLGIGDSRDRARLLGLGFGEVLGCRVDLAELEARAGRLLRHADALPPLRRIGALTLDLLARDGFVGTRRLGLHPREFALVWRLSDKPGEAMGKADLLSDVWRLAHVPDTNSLAVHVSRLRAKLAAAGLEGTVRTMPGGAYALVAPAYNTQADDARPAIPMLTNDSPLADHTILGKRGAVEEDSPHELHVPRE